MTNKINHEFLRKSREDMGLSRPAVVKLAWQREVNISTDAIVKHENGEQVPSARYLKMYADVYKVPMETFFK